MRTLEIWGEHYPAEQIFLGFSEDVHFHPEALLDRVCDFLGIAPLEHWPDATSRVYGSSVASIPAELAVALAARYQNPTRALASRIGSYASWWHYCAEWLVEHGPDGGRGARRSTQARSGPRGWRRGTARCRRSRAPPSAGSLSLHAPASPAPALVRAGRGAGGA